MKTPQQFVGFLIRLLVVWLVDTLALLATAALLSGVQISAVDNRPVFVVAVAVAFTLGIVNFLVRPFLLLAALPLGWAAVFLTGFVINGVVLQIASALMPGFVVDGLWAGILGGLILSLFNTILTTLLAIDDEDSFYENLVQRQAIRQAGSASSGSGRGLVILETDGLSYQRIQKAIAAGVMPTLKQMIDEDGYRVSHIDCGVPPTTPACQAGILQGNNTNIPAFRWLDKRTGKLLAGGSASAIIEPVLSDGNGLLRGGSSIGNMFSGDAAKSILTFSKIFTGTPEDKRQRARDMYLLMRNPYFFTRVLVLFFADVLLELWQGFDQRRKNVQPRLNRLHNGYPFLRAAINVFLRDIGTYFTILDILRGAPAIYTLYAGYDEIAHHSGPYSSDTDISLRQFDKQVRRIQRVIEEKARRPYEILILSDHGQSFGPTFKQRYGLSILDFIQQQLPQNATLSGSGGGDDGTIGVAAMLDELENMQQSKTAGRIGQAVIGGAQRMIQNNLDKQIAFQEIKPAKVTLAYGGNGALVYFDLFPRKVTLNELNFAYPGLVDALVRHEGIGFVIAYDDDFTPVAFGKQGARNLVSGDVLDEDPLLPYGDVDLRAWQLRRMADFENSGDLILNSTLYPDGTVAALEELIGNHGGLGGEQTDAYLFHPGDMKVPKTRGAFEIKNILDSRRGLPGPTPKHSRLQVQTVNPWSMETIQTGLRRVKVWSAYMLRALFFDRSVYPQLARDAYMTAPALLVALVGALAQSIANPAGFTLSDWLVRSGAWLVAILLLYIAARFLRGKADFPAHMRVAGFAQAAYLFGLLAFLPLIGSLARPLALLLATFGLWTGVSAAHELRGWRSLLLPIVYLVTILVTVVFLESVISGAELALGSLLVELGWTPLP